MSATITINFANGTATANSVFVLLSNATVNLGDDPGVTLALTSAVTNIVVASNSVAIATELNAKFDGSLSLSIDWASGAQPAVTLENLAASSSSNPATVLWPTASGIQAQNLPSDFAVVLTGIVSD